MALGSGSTPQDPGFQGNKGESLRNAGVQTNGGGKLDQASCKTVSALHYEPTAWTAVIYQLCVNVCVWALRHHSGQTESFLIRHSSPAHLHF